MFVVRARREALVRIRKAQDEELMVCDGGRGEGRAKKKSLDTKYVEKVAEPAVDGRSWTHTRQNTTKYIPGHTHTQSK